MLNKTNAYLTNTIHNLQLLFDKCTTYYENIGYRRKETELTYRRIVVNRCWTQRVPFGSVNVHSDAYEHIEFKTSRKSHKRVMYIRRVPVE